MFHPLLGNISKLKDADLEAKILDLGKKYHMAARMGNSTICSQLALALDAYKSEQQSRQYAASQMLVKKQNKDLDDLININ